MVIKTNVSVYFVVNLKTVTRKITSGAIICRIPSLDSYMQTFGVIRIEKSNIVVSEPKIYNNVTTFLTNT